jgi:hypothetical protein
MFAKSDKFALSDKLYAFDKLAVQDKFYVSDKFAVFDKFYVSLFLLLFMDLM